MYDPYALYEDPILTDFARAYDEPTFYGERLAPVSRVGVRSGKYRVFGRENWLIFEDRREPGTVANEVRGGRWSLDTFFVKEHSLQAPVHDEETDWINDDGGVEGVDINPEEDATALVTRSVRLRHEKLVADKFRNTANYAAGHTLTLAGAARWDDYTGGTASTSDPVGNIRTAIRTIYTATGRRPNMMALPDGVLEYIENHPRVIDRFKNFSLTDEDAWRRLTGFEGEIIIVDSVYNAANNIDATENIQSFWGKDVWIGIVDRDPQNGEANPLTKTFAKTFSKPYDNGELRPVDRWREEARKTDVVRISWTYDMKITSNVAGYIIKTAIA